MAWSPPLTLAEKLKHFFFPSRLYLWLVVKKNMKKGENELHLLPFMTDKNKASIDIGANKGVFTYLLSKMSTHVYAFEPNPKVYKVLISRKIKNAITYQVAISDKSEVTQLLIPLNDKTKRYSNSGASLSKIKVSGASKSVQVEAKTLDSYAFKNIGFIKIDVEGHEISLLKGATNTLKENRPVLMIELEERHTKQPIESLIKEVESYGYRSLFMKKMQLTDISMFDAEKHHRQPCTREDYVFNFIFLPTVVTKK
jgi:FkbM family methyltransferase